jgi:hypothetical protein
MTIVTRGSFHRGNKHRNLGVPNRIHEPEGDSHFVAPVKRRKRIASIKSDAFHRCNEMHPTILQTRRTWIQRLPIHVCERLDKWGHIKSPLRALSQPRTEFAYDVRLAFTENVGCDREEVGHGHDRLVRNVLIRAQCEVYCQQRTEVDPQKRTPILLKRRCRNGQTSYPVPGGIPGANG